MTTSPTRTAEFDRFGPWIDEVRTPEDVPRLFRSHPVALDDARLVLKVPRSIARRDATPDMDLYDHLLVVDETGLTVLSRRVVSAQDAQPVGDGPFDARHVPFEAVAAVHDVVNLLAGSLTVHGDDGAQVVVRYNGSARANVRRLVDELRSGAATVPGAVGRAVLDAGRSVADSGFEQAEPYLAGDVRDVAQHLTTLQPWAVHGASRVRPRSDGPAGPLGAALQALQVTTLHGAALAGDDLALDVFGRDRWFTRGSKPAHSSSRLVLPLGGLDRLDLQDHPRHRGVVVAAFGAGAATSTLVLPEGSRAHLLLVDALHRLGR